MSQTSRLLQGSVRPVLDWLTDEAVFAWMRSWNVSVFRQPVGDAPFKCVAESGEVVAAEHMEPWGSVKAACTICIGRGLWTLPNA